MDANDPSQCLDAAAEHPEALSLLYPPPPPHGVPCLPRLANLPVSLNDALKWQCPRNGLMMKILLKAKQSENNERERGK